MPKSQSTEREGREKTGRPFLEEEGEGEWPHLLTHLQMLQDPILRWAQERRCPVSFSAVPEVAAVAAADWEKKMNQDRNPHRRYPATEEKGTVTSTAAANAAGEG